MRKFNRVKIYKNNSLKTQKVAKDLIQELKENQYDVGDDFCDLAISIGGDGTFLRMVHESMFDDAICYVGIHTGSLGFLQEIDIDLCPDFVTKLNQNEFREETKGIQETKIITKNGEYYFKSLNEIVIRDVNLKTFEGDIKIDDELLETFAGDGLLISTTTGSTAYNTSLGGSIIHKSIECLIMMPMAPLKNKSYHSLANSLVIPKKTSIFIYPKNTSILITVDGETCRLDDVQCIETFMGDQVIRCLKTNSSSFIQIVHQKLL